MVVAVDAFKIRILKIIIVWNSSLEYTTKCWKKKENVYFAVSAYILRKLRLNNKINKIYLIIKKYILYKGEITYIYNLFYIFQGIG